MKRASFIAAMLGLGSNSVFPELYASAVDDSIFGPSDVSVLQRLQETKRQLDESEYAQFFDRDKAQKIADALRIPLWNVTGLFSAVWANCMDSNAQGYDARRGLIEEAIRFKFPEETGAELEGLPAQLLEQLTVPDMINWNVPTVELKALVQFDPQGILMAEERFIHLAIVELNKGIQAIEAADSSTLNTYVSVLKEIRDKLALQESGAPEEFDEIQDGTEAQPTAWQRFCSTFSFS
jgi:hypothetical protein